MDANGYSVFEANGPFMPLESNLARMLTIAQPTTLSMPSGEQFPIDIYLLHERYIAAPL